MERDFFFSTSRFPSLNGVFVSAAKTAEAKVNLTALGSTGYVAGGPKVWIDGANQIIQKK